MLALAIILISLALAFYTLGVWAERRTGELRWWHVAAFAAGLTADVSGTVVMTMIAKDSLIIGACWRADAEWAFSCG